MIEYQFTTAKVKVAKVKLPETVSACQIGFIKGQLQKLHPEISDFRQNSEYLYGLMVVWKLEKIQ